MKSFTVPQSRAYFRDSREVNEAAKCSGASPMETANQSGEGGGGFLLGLPQPWVLGLWFSRAAKHLIMMVSQLIILKSSLGIFSPRYFLHLCIRVYEKNVDKPGRATPIRLAPPSRVLRFGRGPAWRGNDKQCNIFSRRRVVMAILISPMSIIEETASGTLAFLRWGRSL